MIDVVENVVHDGDLVSDVEDQIGCQLPKSVRANTIPSRRGRRLKFVGVILVDGGLVLSLPKHCSPGVFDHDLQLLMSVVLKQSIDRGIGTGGGDEDGDFPLTQYARVCEFYRIFGLYYSDGVERELWRSGRVDWKGSLRSSQVFVDGNGFLFPYPLLSWSRNRFDNPITHAMRYVLADACVRLGSLIRRGVLGVLFDNPSVQRSSPDKLLHDLRLYFSKIFGTKIRALVADLAAYLEWVVSVGEGATVLGFTDFALCWQSAVATYLDRQLSGFSEDGIPVFSDPDESTRWTHHWSNSEVKVSANRFDRDDVSPVGPLQDFSMRIDHILDCGDVYAVLDSKYKFTIDELDYKQVTYNYFLRDHFAPKKIIFNALVAPLDPKLVAHSDVEKLSRDVHMRTHVIHDSVGPDVGCTIYELYVDVRSILENYIA